MAKENSVIDWEAYGTLLKAARLANGYSRGKKLTDAVEEKTGMRISERTIYALEDASRRYLPRVAAGAARAVRSGIHAPGLPQGRHQGHARHAALGGEVDLPELKYNEAGLIPCIVQDADTGEVLMMAWMSAESLALTLERGETVFWSRSRRELWHKGATSGNTQKLADLRYDCDADTLLALVHPAGPACHTGERTCFYRSMLER